MGRPYKLRHALTWLLKASTGLRSEMFNDIEPEDIKLKPVPHLFLTEAKLSYGSSTFQHYVPIHPDLLPYLKAYIQIYQKKKPFKRMFDNDRTGKEMNKLNVKTVKENKKMNFQSGRYFFEQYTKWNTSMSDELRNYIMAHAIGGISADFYDNATADRIYKKYMEFMKDVKFIPENARRKLDKLIKELT